MTKAITTKPLSYIYQGQTLWLETGTPLNVGKNYTYTLPDGTFLFVPSVYAEALVLYNGEHVSVLHVEAQDEGSEALISYEDGREEYVPLSSIEFI